jgi:twitching motility protein PilT
MARLDELFHYLKDTKGSDLHLGAGLEPRIRRHGHLEKVPNWPVLTDADLKELLREIASPKQWEHYTANLDLDFAYGLEGVARFRANYLNQENGSGAVFRIIPEEIIPIEKLNLPPATLELANLEHGLVLVTGPTGSGKSTTLASIIDKINQEHDHHIVTIEDPIEFVHPNKKSTISQREVGTDTKASPRPCARPSARIPTSSWSAKCATSKPSHWPSPPPKWACWCSGRCTPTAPARPSTA